LTQALPLLAAAFPEGPGGSGSGVAAQRRAMFALRHAAPLAALFGLYGLPVAQVEDALAGQRVSLSCELGLFDRSIGGDCSPQDLGTQLRLLHLAFTAQV
jgi:hypothetical protein